MKSKKYALYVFIAIVLLFLLANVAFYFYKVKIDYYNNLIFPTVEDGNIALFNGYEAQNYNKAMEVELAPGQKFDGLIGLKNHNKEDRIIKTEADPFVKAGAEEKDVKDEEKFQLITMKEDLFKLTADEVKFFEYSVSVPEGFELGEYEAVMAAKDIGENAQKMVKGGVLLDIRTGIKIPLKITNDPKKYEYVDLSLQAKERALLVLGLYGRYLAGSLLIIITLYILYKVLKTKK